MTDINSPRSYNRDAKTTRPVRFERNYTKYAPGSVLVSFGDTKVLCTATVSNRLPPFIKEQKLNHGWLTAEYNMLPSATHTRAAREGRKSQVSGRTHEIQRLIGRALRAVVDLNKMPDVNITVDCDVIQADGGTRVAAINGASLALYDCCQYLVAEGLVKENPFIQFVGAVSLGIDGGQVLCDLDYAEDCTIGADCNLVVAQSGEIIEFQLSAEKENFGKDALDQVYSVGKAAIKDLISQQQVAAGLDPARANLTMTGRSQPKPTTKFNIKTFQGLILALQEYWGNLGCTIVQPLDLEVGAGTSHPMTVLRALTPEPICCAYVQPSRRPTDGRYGENPNRLQHFYQFQVILKPSPDNIQDLYLDSLRMLGFDPEVNDIRFVEDNWENPTLGAWGLGWEVWLNGMEVTQFTYFQQVGGLDCNPVTGEITYGLERLAMYIQGVDNVYDLVWSEGPLGVTYYEDVFKQNEIEQSAYNFEHANVEFLLHCFDEYEKEAQYLLNLDKPLPLPAYERILKAAHCFNLLDARKAVSVTERQRYILRIRTLTKLVAEAYYASREALGFPMCERLKTLADGSQE